MLKTLPNLTPIYQNNVITILAVIIFTFVMIISILCFIVVKASNWILHISEGISIYSHHHKGRTHD